MSDPLRVGRLRVGTAVLALLPSLWVGPLSALASGQDQVPAGAESALEAEFQNRSRATRCAEEDNIDVRVMAPFATRFTITAEHPPYIGLITSDSSAPDFTDCDMSGDPSFSFTPRTVVLHEDASIRLVGHRFSNFWRPEVVDFHVGGRNESGLHLVQLLRKAVPAPMLVDEARILAVSGRPAPNPARRDVEILVVYPSDGYWRAKPLPPPHLPDSAYGSSFLVGPIEDDGRPIVRFKSIRFEPSDLSFHLEFASGSRGVLRVAEDNRSRVKLAVELAQPMPQGTAIAALRSMFVTTINADASLAIGPLPGGQGERHQPILSFDRFRGEWARFGRTIPSTHNLSAPETIFGDFRAPGSRSVAR